jgi:serine/threonine protein kinase
MSPTGDGSPAAGQWPGWPTAAPSLRPLGPNDVTEVGPYSLEALLGEGGMGRVYLGRTRAGRPVAIKVVHRQYASDHSFRKRFEREVATAKQVHGFYTAPVVDADVEADEPWLATAYIAGPSLQYAVTEQGPLPGEAALRLVAGVAEALQSIHAADVIHRDLKPSNVILGADGPTVIDFGISRAVDVTSITRTDVQLGSPPYMAPEQIRGQELTPAVDIFALGGLAAFAATGRPPFGGGEFVAYRVLEQEPDLDGCPEPIRGIAIACLTKDHNRRPTPADVIEMCANPSRIRPPAADDTRPETPAPTPADWDGPPASPKSKRRTKLLIALAIVAVMLAGGVAAWIAVNNRYFVGEAEDGEIAIFRGVRGSTFGIEPNTQVQGSCDPEVASCDKFYVEDLRQRGRDAVREGTQSFNSIPEARQFIQDLRLKYALPTCDSLEGEQKPRPSAPKPTRPGTDTQTAEPPPATSTDGSPDTTSEPPPDPPTTTEPDTLPPTLTTGAAANLLGQPSSGSQPPEPEPGVNCREPRPPGT